MHQYITQRDNTPEIYNTQQAQKESTLPLTPHNDFLGDPTDISAETVSLLTTWTVVRFPCDNQCFLLSRNIG